MKVVFVMVAMLLGCSKTMPGPQTACNVATKVRQGAEAAEAFICGVGASSGSETAPEIWTGEENEQ